MSSSMDYYMEPCTDGPVPSAYEAFVQVNSQHLCLQLAAATATFSLHPCLAIFLTVCACGMPCICISTLRIISPRASTQHAARALQLVYLHINTAYYISPCTQCIALYSTAIFNQPSANLPSSCNMKHDSKQLSRFYPLLQCICSCPVAYANGPMSAPTPAPMMAPASAPAADSNDSEDMPSDSSAASASASASVTTTTTAGTAAAGECNKPVPTQYEAFTDVSTQYNASLLCSEFGLFSVSLP